MAASASCSIVRAPFTSRLSPRAVTTSARLPFSSVIWLIRIAPPPPVAPPIIATRARAKAGNAAFTRTGLANLSNDSVSRGDLVKEDGARLQHAGCLQRPADAPDPCRRRRTHHRRDDRRLARRSRPCRGRPGGRSCRTRSRSPNSRSTRRFSISASARETTRAVALRLAERGVPFAVATGHDAALDGRRVRAAPAIAEAIRVRKFRQVVDQLLARRGVQRPVDFQPFSGMLSKTSWGPTTPWRSIQGNLQRAPARSALCASGPPSAKRSREEIEWTQKTRSGQHASPPGPSFSAPAKRNSSFTRSIRAGRSATARCRTAGGRSSTSFCPATSSASRSRC